MLTIKEKNRKSPRILSCGLWSKGSWEKPGYTLTCSSHHEVNVHNAQTNARVQTPLHHLHRKPSASLIQMSVRSLSKPVVPEVNKDGGTETLALNVLLLGGRQSGRSSVGNALIGGAVFRSGPGFGGVSVTSRPQRVSRTFPRYFRRNGAESHLSLRVIDTPPAKPRPQEVRAFCPDGVHAIVMVVRADLIGEETQLEREAESLFGPDWFKHSLLVLTHVDDLKEAGLQPSLFLAQAPDWLRALADRAAGGVLFVDSGSDWPSLTGEPIRERVLSLSARNHHQTLAVIGLDVKDGARLS